MFTMFFFLEMIFYTTAFEMVLKVSWEGLSECLVMLTVLMYELYSHVN